MIDIKFYMHTHEYKRRLMSGSNPMGERAGDYLDICRSPIPLVFNIETTNACNMTCSFCPRTTQMTRPVKTMEPEVFMKVALQLTPHPDYLWERWLAFAQEQYQVPLDEQSENAFFLYVLPKVIVLHGYGDPLLDPHIPSYVGILNRMHIPTYFSCNPGNINITRTAKAFDHGLDYIKYSIDSVSDPVRGKDVFERDFANICKVLEMKAQRSYKTQVIVTMIDTGRDEFGKLKAMFEGTGVYTYLKSLDQAWMVGGDKPKSIHWSEFCQMPWSSMTINSSGLAVSCQEDFDGEIVLGDAKEQSLHEIWNGKKYAELRRAHVVLPDGHRCAERCDMQVIGKWL